MSNIARIHWSSYRNWQLFSHQKTLLININDSFILSILQANLGRNENKRKLAKQQKRNRCKLQSSTHFCSLTPWEPGNDIFVPGNRPKTSSCRLPYQRHSSSADCARELFKPSKDLASLLGCTWKKIFDRRLQIFCEWRHSWSSFCVILAHVTWPRAQLLDQSISLKLSLETRFESKSFEPLIDFLAFLVL